MWIFHLKKLIKKGSLKKLITLLGECATDSVAKYHTEKVWAGPW
jgi:hypothetical protein